MQDASFSPGWGRILSRGDTDYTLRVFGGETGKLSRGLPGPAFTNLAVAYSPDGSRLLSSDSGHTLKLWDGQGIELLRTWPSRPAK